jgi:hypothetical protein
MFLVGKQTFFWLKPAGSPPYRTGSSPAACGGLNFVTWKSLQRNVDAKAISLWATGV